MSNNLAFQVRLSDPYDEAIDRVSEALKFEGFGILTQIDVKATLKQKLDADFRPYIILGACNPPLSKRALENEALSGLLLPCNVTVEETADGSLVSIVNPEVLLDVGELGENPVVFEVATEARVRLERVAMSLRSNNQ
jgi:uncharacterized protein (DUF302 family)